ncbi:hypothetical protein [Streptomyces avicenniae]|uniref:hypothetical protein n=1 Tax=Streptomyces avicenniae TaxID=500153 RepID=UPI001CBA6797|nr:hypothetical protein [Streptomyces avicenniae]
MAGGQVTAADVEVIVTWQGDSARLRGHSNGGRINLRPGEELNFGISKNSGKVQPNAELSLGAIKIFAQRPVVSNFTASTTYAVENLEGGAELVKVRPRQLDLMIPFEMSRILIPTSGGATALTVYAPPPRLLQMGLATQAMVSSISLDKTSKYFAVLVALCEPRLRGSSMAAVPSLREVVERLREVDQFRDANRSSVNYHIDYLAGRKLPVGQWSKCEDDGPKHSKREALVAFALRFDLVNEEDLQLLASPASRRAVDRIPA